MATTINDITSQKTIIEKINEKIIDLNTKITAAQYSYNTAKDTWNQIDSWWQGVSGVNTDKSKIVLGATTLHITGQLDSMGIDWRSNQNLLYIYTEAGRVMTERESYLNSLKSQLAELQGNGPKSLKAAQDTLAALELNYANEAKTTAYLNMTPEQRIAADKAVADAKLAADKAAQDAQTKKTITYVVIFVVVAVVAAFIWKKVL